MSNKNIWIRDHALLVLLVGVIFLRIAYQLWQNVPVLNQDESALLLNARFIAQTGHDEWQQVVPITFRSFGDYKLPGYVYVTSLLGSLLGFSMMTVRLASMAAGIGNIALAYLLGKRLFSKSVGWWSALLLTISPWSWHFSSVGFEANVGLFFFLLALYFALQKPITIRSGIVVVFSLLLGGLTYNSPFLLSPLIFFAILLWHGFRDKAASTLLSVLLATVLTLLLLTLPATLQKGGISIFTDPTLLSNYPEYRSSFSGITQTLLGNQYIYFAKKIFSSTIESFGWKFLVVRGGSNPWHTIPDTGHLHFMIPILSALSLGGLLKNILTRKAQLKSWLLIGLLLGSLAPAIITVDAPHATRSLFFFFTLTLLAGVSLSTLWQWLEGKSLAYTYRTMVLFFLVIGAVSWWLPSRELWRSEAAQSRRWPIGLPEQLHQLPPDLKDVYVYDPHGVLYAAVANETNMKPQVFWETVSRSEPDTAGLVKVEKLGRFRFVEQKPTNSEGYYLAPISAQKWSIIEL